MNIITEGCAHWKERKKEHILENINTHISDFKLVVFVIQIIIHTLLR